MRIVRFLEGEEYDLALRTHELECECGHVFQAPVVGGKQEICCPRCFREVLASSMFPEWQELLRSRTAN